MTIDETIVHYQPRKSTKMKVEEIEPIPIVYIPRKPVPNGLEFFLACSYISHPTREESVLPFIVDMIPHLEVGDSNPQEMVEKVISR